MSRTISPATNKPYGLRRVCEVWEVPRSSFYRLVNPSPQKRGAKPIVEEPKLLEAIRENLQRTPFKGEGHKKVHARLKRRGIKAGRNRVLRVMRENALLSPHRNTYNFPNPHEGRITTDLPNIM